MSLVEGKTFGAVLVDVDLVAVGHGVGTEIQAAGLVVIGIGQFPGADHGGDRIFRRLRILLLRIWLVAAVLCAPRRDGLRLRVLTQTATARRKGSPRSRRR